MKHRFIVFLLGVLACAPFPVVAQENDALADAVTGFTLDNGLEVVVIEDHRAPIVTHMLWYRVGSADEKPGKSGIAHYLEHLMFKGTKTVQPGEFSNIVEANGGSENAFTSFDYTGYFQRVAADRLSLMMRLEADRMRNLVLTEEQVLPERDVILEERKSRIDGNPNSIAREQRRAVQFINHPYGSPVIGWPHEIAQYTRQDALDFYDLYYAPNNAILVVAGDVTPEEVRFLAKQHYGPLQPSAHLPERVRPQEPEHSAPIRVISEDRRVRRPYVIRNYLAPNRKAGDQTEAAALVLLAELLGGGQTSVFGRKLQIEQKVSVGSSAFYDGVSFDPDTFGVYIVPATGVSLEDAEAALDKALADFWEEGVDLEHLERIKTRAKADRIYLLDDQQARARLYGEALTSGLRIEDVQDWTNVLASITPDEIIAVGQKTLNLKNSVTGWVRPPKETQK